MLERFDPQDVFNDISKFVERIRLDEVPTKILIKEPMPRLVIGEKERVTYLTRKLL